MISPSVRREQVPWYPTIDLSKCAGDQACVQFCPHTVYRWDPATDRPVVADPYNCVVACSRCVSICPPGAISFPTLDWLGEYLENFREPEARPGCS